MTMQSITGKVASDPLARVTRSGVTTAQFFIKNEQLYYHVRCYSALAETVAAFLKTGAVVTIRGKFKVDSWIDHNDIKHWQTRILAIGIQILDPIESKATKDVEQASA